MNKGRFLIVEDEYMVAENLRSDLIKMDYEVVGLAPSGLQAIELAAKEKPDLALMDIKLSGEMDGIETAVYLREILNIPALFLTAFADEACLERAKVAEPLGYLIKPYQQKGLRASIEIAYYKARMEKLLKENESRFRTMFENIPIAYLAIDEAGRCVDFNPEFCSLLGYDFKDLVNMNLVELLDPKSRHLYPEYFEKIRNDRQLQTEFYLLRKDNTLRTVHFKGQVQYNLNNDSILIHCIMMDITEQKRLEEERRQTQEALWKQHELQRVLLSAIPAYVYIKDTDSVYMVGNHKFSELSGVPVDEIPGKTDFDFFPETAANNFRANDAEILSSGEARTNYEMQGKDTNGNTIWFSTTQCPYYGLSGEIEGLIGVCFDITDRKHAEEERLRMERRLQQAQKAESLARMAGAIAHHFNNQLFIVIGYMEMLKDNISENSEDYKMLLSAIKASHNAADMSKLMLTYLGKVPTESKQHDLSKICQTCFSVVNSIIPKNVSVKTVFPSSSGPIINANSNQIQQIVTNLITNASESIEDMPGFITFTVKSVSSSDILSPHVFPVSWKPEENTYACIEVSDTGAGIKKTDFGKIFDPFFTTKFIGRGLGLAVVLGIVSSYKGGISFESIVGKGSTFRVFLPVSAESIPAPFQKADESKNIKGTGTVLLIDDESHVRDMAKMMLKRLGYDVLEAMDGIEAVKIFQEQQNKIRFVLTDLTMPGMNGWDILDALRKISPDIPVILSSGYDEAQVMADEHNELPNAFLGKPYRLKDLDETIRQVLERITDRSSLFELVNEIDPLPSF